MHVLPKKGHFYLHLYDFFLSLGDFDFDFDFDYLTLNLLLEAKTAVANVQFPKQPFKT